MVNDKQDSSAVLKAVLPTLTTAQLIKLYNKASSDTHLDLIVREMDKRGITIV